MSRRLVAEQIFREGIERVLPDKLISNVIELDDNRLRIGEQNFSFDSIKNIHVIGAGKASAMMGLEVEKILGGKINQGHIVVKYGHACRLKYIEVTEAGHPVPDKKGFKAAVRIREIAEKAGADDLVICIISGGGSALLPDFPEGSSPDDMMKVGDLLVNCGASISEINAVRKHLSTIKGGHLARAVYPAILVSLILSDVPGDHPDVIASGPTAPDPTTFRQALDVLEKFNLTGAVPHSIRNYLIRGNEGKYPETPKPGDSVFEKVYNLIVGSNRFALEAAGQKALEFNFYPLIIDDELQGDVSSVAEYLVETALNFKNDEDEVKPVCLLFGGETTVNMTGKGKGGRNQHLALLCASLLRNQPGITILCAGTDGTDGPTDAAGAVVDSDTYTTAVSKRIDPETYIREFDSYHFFKKIGGQIVTGPTMTNVMDIIVIIVDGSGEHEIEMSQN